MTQPHSLTLSKVKQIAFEKLIKSGATKTNAEPLADAIMAAERDGISSHGLMYLPVYCLHLQCGKVHGEAAPVVEQTRPSAITVNAQCGFAHPAILKGFKPLIETAKKQGIACLAINHSYNCGVLGYHTEMLAQHGLLAIGFTNAPASIAPVGSNQPVIGTNPFSLAVPATNDTTDETSNGTSNAPILVIDQSASVVAKSELIKRSKNNQSIPDNWALDAEGNPTTDPQLGLKGSMLPSGGYKGFGMGLMVEVLAAAMTGATLGIHAAPFGGDQGGPPSTGQFFIAIDPQATSNNHFGERIHQLATAISEQENARLPGEKRLASRKQTEQQGITIADNLWQTIQAI